MVAQFSTGILAHFSISIYIFMKTFEGIYTIKWGKNTTLDIRPITFDCISKEELRKEQQRIVAAFSEGDDKESPFF